MKKTNVILFWFEVPVDDPQAVKMVQSQGQLCKVKLHILLCKHDLNKEKDIYFLLFYVRNNV